ncbi:MAG: GGDEF domain-containing protein [Nitrospinae bacterium]|nr:GGDEF domain-containing protein [Nitrospinota bacterium]MDA1108457.1 GGDEF domain-containing protein [Nitrospinota bacterium]
MDMFRKNTKPEKKVPVENSATKEFNERISRLLMVCIEGICKLIPKKDALCENLESLGTVVKKVTRPKPVSGLAKDIEDFFSRQHLEVSFLETKNDTVKQIVLDLTGAIQEITSTTIDFDQKMELSIEEIQAAGNIDDILALKDGIIAEIKKVRISSQSIKKELNEYRRTTQSLSSKLEQTEAKALVDALTNVLNRNAYNMKISQMIREFSRVNEPFCLLVIDIDHFKKFNDQYGHKAGDRVLRSVAASVQESLRASDLVFRYGGEEFVVILGGADLGNAAKLAEKVRQGVEKDYYIDKEKNMKVTVSLGVACVQPEDTELSLFERADKALYVAKRKGRNQVEIAE